MFSLLSHTDVSLNTFTSVIINNVDFSVLLGLRLVYHLPIVRNISILLYGKLLFFFVFWYTRCCIYFF